MENLHIVLSCTLTAVALLLIIVPNIPRNRKIAIVFAILFLILTIQFLHSDAYKDWKHFAENKLSVTCEQFPPITADQNNFYYKYIIFFHNSYPETARIQDFHMNFQTALTIDSHEILLSDIPKSSLMAQIEGTSILSARADGFNGGQMFSLLVECSLPRRGLLLANKGATLNFTYKLFSKSHNKSVYINPMHEMSLQMPKKEAVVFDVFKVLDNRMLPEFFFTYNYPLNPNKSDSRTLEVFCGDNNARLLSISYTSPSEVITLESECPVHKDFDPIRIVVLANNDISVYSWLGYFRKHDIALQFRQGIELVDRADYNAGAVAFRKVTELDPLDYKAWFNYGLALVHTKDYKSAIDAFQNALNVKGDYAKAHFQLGSVLIETGDQDGATVHLKRAIEINPRYSLAYFNLGVLQVRQGNNAEGLHNINQAITYESRPEIRDRMEEEAAQMQGLKSGGSQAYMGEAF
jgi:hypothetical protein